jgi:hypothetical protein
VTRAYFLCLASLLTGCFVGFNESLLDKTDASQPDVPIQLDQAFDAPADLGTEAPPDTLSLDFPSLDLVLPDISTADQLVPPDLSTADQLVPPDLSTADQLVCPAGCGGCPGGVCVKNCTSSCPGKVTCPPGIPCKVDCGATQCAGGVDCSKATTCSINCVGKEACQSGQILCGSGSCGVVCDGNNTCKLGVNCMNSCSCSVLCKGTESCKAGVTCPTFCSTCAPTSTCDKCP